MLQLQFNIDISKILFEEFEDLFICTDDLINDIQKKIFDAFKKNNNITSFKYINTDEYGIGVNFDFSVWENAGEKLILIDEYDVFFHKNKSKKI